MTAEEQINLFSLPESEPSSHPSSGDFDTIPLNSQIPINSNTYSSLDQLTIHCNGCQRCQLSQTRTHVVISRGNPHALIMIVGEGPGQNEDETGLPFVGKGGQLLDKILASVELTENDVYICNIVKCRPPGNRVPTKEEVDACKGYLLEQIRIVNPMIILLTGATALKGLLGITQGITKVRGQWIDHENRYFMPIFHPAYLLRNPSKEKGSPKWLMWQDIQAVRKRWNEIKTE
ncbi:MAG: uracil-DNA glycosylase [Cyanobacteria bacterium WB6_1B_304]|jgi:DNA polymerase|nr:uracil-DNA glycosylase [Cyanobacteria bacterium WB6_1B_304]